MTQTPTATSNDDILINKTVDFLKINAPFWKKEHSPKGAKWVKQNKRDLEINF